MRQFIYLSFSTQKTSAPTGRIFMKYDIKIFVESVEKIQFLLQSENNNRYCT